ncbi:MAG TPA: holo-ACP synthase [Gammaproteobacteria bacterium]|nr:holo-ACP synthase [Gammaproteobacteria bacterium]
MIIGIGTDIVQIARIDKSLTRFGDRFAQRVLTEEEYAIFLQQSDQARYLSGRFAAKEAAVKALGTGFSQGIGFTQIGVRHDAAGKPELYFLGLALKKIQQKNAGAAHLSITHEKEYALAFVVLEV